MVNRDRISKSVGILEVLGSGTVLAILKLLTKYFFETVRHYPDEGSSAYDSLASPVGAKIMAFLGRVLLTVILFLFAWREILENPPRLLRIWCV